MAERVRALPVKQWPWEILRIEAELTRTKGPEFARVIAFALRERARGKFRTVRLKRAS